MLFLQCYHDWLCHCGVVVDQLVYSDCMLLVPHPSQRLRHMMSHVGVSP